MLFLQLSRFSVFIFSFLILYSWEDKIMSSVNFILGAILQH
jgi:hypothetical protein